MSEPGVGKLRGKVALVTGASSGLGRATAIALAAVGADVALVARSSEDLRSVAAEVIDSGGRAISLPTDLASSEQTLAAVETTVSEFGKLDILVNAAGTDAPGAVADLDVAGWDRTLDVNLRAPFLLSGAAFPHMRDAGSGLILNVSSVAGKKGWANAAAYCASKFGLTGLTESLADEGRAHGIRACIIYPGAMATNWGAWTPEDRGEESGEQEAPESKALPPSQVADFIVWLAAAPPSFVLTEGIIVPVEEGLP